MDYWRGVMNWPLAKDWKCETCALFAGLTWGLPHARCRCNSCHTEYRMRDKDDNVVNIPISQLMEEYKQAAKDGWEKYQRPLNEWTDEMWDGVMETQHG